MKRRQLVRHLTQHGCTIKREGAKHTVFVNTGSGKQTQVPRHREIDELLADVICDQLGVPPVRPRH